MFEKIQEIIANVCEGDKNEITLDTKFEDLGIDSLEIAEIVMDLEDEFGLELTVTPEITKVSNLVTMIEEAKKQ